MVKCLPGTARDKTGWGEHTIATAGLAESAPLASISATWSTEMDWIDWHACGERGKRRRRAVQQENGGSDHPHNFNKRATNLGFGHLVRKLLAQSVAKGVHAGVGRKGNRL